MIGVGVSPDVRLARSAGLEIGRASAGFAARRSSKSSAPGVFAAGDMCEYDSPDARRAVARRALGCRVQPGADRRAQHARPAKSPTTSSRTSSPTSRTGRRWSTSGPPTAGTRRSCADHSRTASSRIGTSRTVACGARSRWGARRTSSTRGGLIGDGPELAESERAALAEPDERPRGRRRVATGVLARRGRRAPTATPRPRRSRARG